MAPHRIGNHWILRSLYRGAFGIAKRCKSRSVTLGKNLPAHTSRRPPQLKILSRLDRTRTEIAASATCSAVMLPTDGDLIPSGDWTKESKNSLFVVLGLSINTSIDSVASSTRSDSLQPRIANFAAQYSVLSGTALCARTDPIFRIAGLRPEPRAARNQLKHSRVNSAGAKKLTSITCRNLCSSA